jgi:photosystem II stability/assembly factor-like uncharacterized protein
MIRKPLLIVAAALVSGSLLAAGLPGGWSIRKCPAKRLLTSGAFANEQIGWLAGIECIVKTSNGGESYQRQWPVAKDEKRYWFNSVVALSDKVVMATGFPYGWKGDGAILRSEDGGQTWSKVAVGGAPTDYSGIVFLDNKSTGFLITGRQQLWRSQNGGTDWKRCNLPGGPRVNLVAKRTIAVASPTVLYAVEAAHAGQYLLKSTDAGDTWQRVSIPKGLVKPRAPIFTDLATAGPDHIWASFYYEIWVESLDGGKTWRKSTAPGAVFMRDDKRGYAITDYTIAETADGGQTWSEPQTLSAGGSKMRYIVFTPKKDIVIGGNEGTGTYFIVDRPQDAGSSASEEGILEE